MGKEDVMKNIKQTTGYLITGHGIFLSRGRAIDNSCTQNDKTIDYFTVQIESFEDEDLTKESQLLRLAVVENDTNKVLWLSNWTTQEVNKYYLNEAWKMLDGTRHIEHSSKMFDTTVYEKPKFPQTVTFEIDKQGRIFTRIQMEPNVYGKYTPGKVFFPDRSWKGTLFTGNAVCNIASEKEAYGFLTGYMCPLPSISLEELLDHLWQKRLYQDDVLITCYKLNGSDTLLYGVIPNGESFEYSVIRVHQFTKDEMTGSKVYLSQISFDFNSKEFKQAIQWQKKLGDLWLADATDGEITMDMLEADMKPSSYFVNRNIKGRWVRSFKSTNNDLIDDAIEDQVVDYYNLSGYDIFCLRINPSMFGKLSAYSIEEIKQLITDVSTLNRLCDEQITTKIKRGQIALVRFA